MSDRSSVEHFISLIQGLSGQSFNGLEMSRINDKSYNGLLIYKNLDLYSPKENNLQKEWSPKIGDVYQCSSPGDDFFSFSINIGEEGSSTRNPKLGKLEDCEFLRDLDIRNVKIRASGVFME